jgi:hypothetical protein
MAITAAQKAALEEIIQVLTTMKSPRKKRVLSEMFLELVNRAEWPEYYEVWPRNVCTPRLRISPRVILVKKLIPEPRCLNNIRSSVEKNRYKEVLDAYTDLSLVFWNALFYNEPDSQISEDAGTLKARVCVLLLLTILAYVSCCRLHWKRSGRSDQISCLEDANHLLLLHPKKYMQLFLRCPLHLPLPQPLLPPRCLAPLAVPPRL